MRKNMKKMLNVTNDNAMQELLKGLKNLSVRSKTTDTKESKCVLLLIGGKDAGGTFCLDVDIHLAIYVDQLRGRDLHGSTGCI